MTALQEHVTRHFEQSIAVQQQVADSLKAPTAQAAHLILQCLMNDGKILACGNGGAALTAQHFVGKMTYRFEKERMELAAVALTADVSTLTAVGIGCGFSRIFSKQVKALGKAGDVLLAVSDFGQCANILEAVKAAHERNMHVIALSGYDGGEVAAILKDDDILLNVPHQRAVRIQEIHILLVHALCDCIDEMLLLDV